MKPRVALAFSGGLDTSYCCVALHEDYGLEVHTVTADTGGFSAAELADLEKRAHILGAASHRTLDVRPRLFDRFLRYLVYGNVLRGQVYPLCVAAERVAQAEAVALAALELGATAIAHGSTGAGNDQVRFDVAFKVLAPQLRLIAPIRESGLARARAAARLGDAGLPVPEEAKRFSINRGLWGNTVGGGPTHDSDATIPDDAYPATAPPAFWPDAPERLTLEFAQGVPVAVDGRALSPVDALLETAARAGAHGVGRGVHLGDTILGIKGRVGFEAPAAVTLITAHRELEKLVLTRAQQNWKETLGNLYGSMLHEGHYFDPLMRDLEAFLESTQQHVSGTVRVRLFKGQASVEGVRSAHSLLQSDVALYGEENHLWDGRDAQGFCRLYALQEALAARRDRSVAGTAGGQAPNGAPVPTSAGAA
ncbi:MAG: argininosuccinate synthase [Candidatus Eisenbacteria bacterium]|nr:argininosuccinate synthase [Candidatus Eisenbacteria bacterium]